MHIFVNVKNFIKKLRLKQREESVQTKSKLRLVSLKLEKIDIPLSHGKILELSSA